MDADLAIYLAEMTCCAFIAGFAARAGERWPFVIALLLSFSLGGYVLIVSAQKAGCFQSLLAFFNCGGSQ